MKRPQKLYNFGILLFLATLFLLSGCKEKKQKLICIYNTQSGYWRTQMSQEMVMEAAKHPDLRLEFRTKKDGDETEDEMNAIEYFISQKPDAIIFVSDNPYLRNHIRQAQNQGIPIILLNNNDPKINYTVRITNNNVKAGRDAAHYIADQLQGKGNILEIIGSSGSATDRTEGFHSVIDSFPDIHIIGSLKGSYSRPISHITVTEFLQNADLSQPIDAVFAQNDRMAIGAHEAFDEVEETSQWNTLFFGIDGLMCDSVGVERLLDETINTSMLLPTGGREAIQQAVRLINGMPFERDIELNAYIINKDSVPRLRREWNKTVKQYQESTDNQIKSELQKKRYSQLEILLWMGLFITAILLCTIVWLYNLLRTYKNKVEKLNNEKQTLANQNNGLMQKLTILETERNVLTTQRDRWFDLRAITTDDKTEEELSADQGTFRNRLLSIIRKHMEDESCNVEMLGDIIGLSRVQLNRKVKTEFNMSPGDLLRKTRMEHAMHLLRTTDFTISEVAYRVGYSNGKYFTRAFKDQFDCTPSEIKRGKGMESNEGN